MSDDQEVREGLGTGVMEFDEFKEQQQAIEENEKAWRQDLSGYMVDKKKETRREAQEKREELIRQGVIKKPKWEIS